MERLHEQILLLLKLVKDNIGKTRICLVSSYSAVGHLVLGLPFKGFSISSGLQDIYIYLHTTILMLNIFLAIHVVLMCGFVITTRIIRGTVEVQREHTVFVLCVLSYVFVSCQQNEGQICNIIMEEEWQNSEKEIRKITFT
jgi:hypothetical protein